MRVDLYRTHQKNSFLILPQGTPFSSLAQAVLDQLGSLQFYSTEELDRTFIGINSKTILEDFQSKGYSVRSIKTEGWEQN